MKVWLVTIGEPLPTDGEGGDRLYRAGILGTLLAKRGHDVVWWSSTFDHVRKRHRFPADTSLRLESGVELKLLHGCGYPRNVSIRRLLDHAQLARKFARQAEPMPRPDVILCSLPPLELPGAAAAYGRRHGVPVIIDVRDLWPDIFLELVPAWAKAVFEAALRPLRRQARNACVNAFAITGNSPHFVRWGLDLAGRARTDFDRPFFHGYSTVSPDPSALAEANAFWAGHGVSSDPRQFVACFFGAIGPQSELEVVVEAARRLERAGKRFKFVLCGKGDRLAALLRDSGDVPSVVFPGWIDAAKIKALMRMSQAGLAVYRSNAGYVTNLPNKPIEYLSEGLPVVSSLKGYLENFLRENACGVTYANGDAEALAWVLSELNEDRTKLEEMSLNARRVFAENFDAERVYGGMMEYLEEVAAARRPRAGG